MESIEQVLKKAAQLRRQSRSLLFYAAVTAGMSIQAAQAQTFAEWFNQKSTQKKYLYQQIAALQIYKGYLQNGYRIAKGGLGSIGGYVKKEFSIHASYYKYLRSASSVVRNQPQVRSILNRQTDIIDATAQMKSQTGLTNDERSYIYSVRKALLDDCDARLSDLTTAIAAGKTAMSDEERLRQIERIHAAMQDNYRFAANFLAELKLFVQRKKAFQQDINTLSQLYGNH